MGAKQLTVLLCDDSMLVRKQLKETLTEAGVATVLEAGHGQEALPLVQKHNPQIIFLDIVMPVMDGIETLKEIKKINTQTKVIMITSSGTQTYLKTALEEGAYDFIQKPWKESQILSIIHRLKK